MLAKRIIPCLDVHAGRVVKGVNFLNLRDAGDPVDVIVNNNLVARGEVLVLNGNFCVRIAEILSPDS